MREFREKLNSEERIFGILRHKSTESINGGFRDVDGIYLVPSSKGLL